MASWIDIRDDSDFSLQNLPYGSFSTKSLDKRIGVAIGDWVLDIKALSQHGVFDDLHFNVEVLQKSTLNAFAALEKKYHLAVREKLQQLLRKDTNLAHVLKDNKVMYNKTVIPMTEVQMHLPMDIGDYTDFFIGYHHAVNVRKFSHAELIQENT